jgi:hypothetical protein
LLRRWRQAKHIECGDRPQQPLAVAKHDPKLFEVGLGQIGQYRFIYRVFAKDRFILREPQTAQLGGNVHGFSTACLSCH